MFTIHFKNPRGIVKNMNKMIHWANYEVRGLTEQEAEDGAIMAKNIAPRQTGALIQGIEVPSSPSQSGWKIVSRVPKNPKDKRRIPYHVYLHLGLRGRYVGGRKSGDHEYMWTVARLLAQKYPADVKKSLEKQIKNLK